jgi:hypothetical protein
MLTAAITQSSFTYITFSFLLCNLILVVVAIDNNIPIIQVQIGKNTIEDVLLDGGYKVNIIIEQ